MDLATLLEILGYVSSGLQTAVDGVQLSLDTASWISELLGWISENTQGILDVIAGLVG